MQKGICRSLAVLLMAIQDTISSHGMPIETTQYAVPGVGTFNSHFKIDFTTATSLPSPLVKSTYTVNAGTAPYARQFNASNIIISPGHPLQMVIPGDQTQGPVQSAQMTTAYDDVLYGSVRTVAKASSISGAVHGFFMYWDDNQETDIEIRTADITSVHFTNQPVSANAPETTISSPAPSDITTAFHEYRYDWLPGRTDFYIDGVRLVSLEQNVPTEPGYLMWNHWSNGNSWSEGPPLADSVLYISSIEAFFNRTSKEESLCDSA